jgi:hypothetical protein
MIALMISNCEKLRAPPPSIVDSYVRAISRRRKEFEPKLAIIRPCFDVISLGILIREFNRRLWVGAGWSTWALVPYPHTSLSSGSKTSPRVLIVYHIVSDILERN